VPPPSPRLGAEQDREGKGVGSSQPHRVPGHRHLTKSDVIGGRKWAQRKLSDGIGEEF